MLFNKFAKEVIKTNNKKPFALLLGNGINYGLSDEVSWLKLLESLYTTFYINSHIEFSNNFFNNNQLSYTEFFDIINNQNIIHSKSKEQQLTYEIKKSIKEKISKWKGNQDIKNNPNIFQKHKDIVYSCLTSNIPILTTNYDDLLISANADILKISARKGEAQTFKPFFNKFNSDIYPFNCYYSNNKIPNNSVEKYFAIWHIHGMINYYRSIRIGQHDYILLLSKLNNILKSKDIMNFGQISHLDNTWLKLFFTSNIIIVGFGLGLSEIVVRWLLNQRHKYNSIHEAQLETYFLSNNKPKLGQSFYFENMGIKHVKIDYKSIYKELPKILEKLGSLNPRKNELRE